jgi:hypothetical protein
MNIRIFAVALSFAVPFVMAQPDGVPPGPPAVEITGTVDTNVVNTPDVVVVNTLLDPVPTVLGGEPFQITHSFDDWGGESFRTVTHDIPFDKMIIVQTVSVSALVEPGQEVKAEVRSQGVGFGLHPILLTRQGTFDGLDLYVGTMSLTGFATGDGGVRLSAVRNSTSGDGGRVEFALVGYIVDIHIP